MVVLTSPAVFAFWLRRSVSPTVVPLLFGFYILMQPSFVFPEFPTVFSPLFFFLLSHFPCLVLFSLLSLYFAFCVFLNLFPSLCFPYALSISPLGFSLFFFFFSLSLSRLFFCFFLLCFLTFLCRSPPSQCSTSSGFYSQRMKAFSLCCCRDGVTVGVHHGSRETCPLDWSKSRLRRCKLFSASSRNVKKTVNIVE